MQPHELVDLPCTNLVYAKNTHARTRVHTHTHMQPHELVDLPKNDRRIRVSPVLAAIGLDWTSEPTQVCGGA